MQAEARRLLEWREAVVIDSRRESSSARSLVFDVPGWSSHVAGQHIDLRLTAEDGYQATRSYSLSSGPGEQPEITIERVEGGEVSPFLVEDVVVGDQLEVRGPIGGYFVWNAREENTPVLLIGGGSGVAPLRAIWRAAAEVAPVTVLYSARNRDRVVFGNELAANDNLRAVTFLTREALQGFRSGRIDQAAIAEAVGTSQPSVFVCGPTSFVETMATHLVAVGVDPMDIRTERFG